MTAIRSRWIVGAAMLAGAVPAFALLAGSPPSAAAPWSPRTACDTISFENVQHVFFRKNMRCGAAKDMARHLRRSHGDWEPRRFRCSSGTNYQRDGSCTHRQHPNTFFLYYPEH
jgi:hypothetical protein